jgi:hypothetical protein
MNRQGASLGGVWSSTFRKLRIDVFDAERRFEFSAAFQRRDQAVNRSRRLATVEFALVSCSFRSLAASQSLNSELGLD